MGWALQEWCDGTKWLEVRKLLLLPANFAPGCVITLDVLGNCVVDLVFQVFYREQQIKRRLKGIHICVCQRNDILKVKTDRHTRLAYTRNERLKIKTDGPTHLA